MQYFSASRVEASEGSCVLNRLELLEEGFCCKGPDATGIAAHVPVSCL
jgi:hypothetical protein